ncbi:hypothetical protein V6N11_052822 [Hibiscus sabdariffa]|uniref:Uncharacterized protein n=1 Tax=Hibiscus sabdariffa TaxID=183260 RepID=A0ABR2UB76_9ROSI
MHQDCVSFVSNGSLIDNVSNSCNEAAASVFSVSCSKVKTDCSQLVENFKFPKISLIPKNNAQQVQSGCMPGTNQVPSTQSSTFKFPVKLLVYQRRPKPSIQSVSLPSQQAGVCLYQGSSSDLSSVPVGSDGSNSVLVNAQELSAGNSNISDGLDVGLANVPGGVLADVQECFADNSNISAGSAGSKSSLFPAFQESQVSINSYSGGSKKQLQSVSSEVRNSDSQSSSTLLVKHGGQNSSVSSDSGFKMSCHPMLTRSKIGSLKKRNLGFGSATI